MVSVDFAERFAISSFIPMNELISPRTSLQSLQCSCLFTFSFLAESPEIIVPSIDGVVVVLLVLAIGLVR